MNEGNNEDNINFWKVSPVLLFKSGDHELLMDNILGEANNKPVVR